MLGENYKRGEEVDRVRDLIQAILCASAHVPEAVCVSPRQDGKRITFFASAAPEDQMKLLDKNGPALKALRIIVGAMAQSLSMDFCLELASDY